jgi:predicted acyltransferase (DUF342 family)
MVFDRKTLVIPDGTRFEEKMIVTTGDVIIADRCLVEFGIKTDGRIFIGEHAIIDGGLESDKDIRVDIFSSIGGDVSSGGNVYLGEKVKVQGKLSLQGDLDVGDSVEIGKGFEAKGWINIRSPIPMIIYIFIYLSQLLKMGRSEEIQRILEEIEESQGETIPISETFLYIPTNSIIGVQKSKIDSHVSIGPRSQVLGNYEVKGNVMVGDNAVVHGTVKASGSVLCGKHTSVKGNVDAMGDIRIDEHADVAGNISGGAIYLSKNAIVNGTLFGRKGMSFTTPSSLEAEEKVRRFESNVGMLDEVEHLLE